LEKEIAQEIRVKEKQKKAGNWRPEESLSFLLPPQETWQTN